MYTHIRNFCQPEHFSSVPFYAINTDMEPTNLYQPEELTEAQTAKRRAGRAMLIVACLGLAVCVVLCCCTTRQNQGVTFPLTVGASILTGWVVIFLSHSRYEGAKARVCHVELMLTGPRERFEGRFEKLEGTWRVKKGVPIRKVRQSEEFHEMLLSVYAEKADKLPDTFDGAVETVYDCIVAFREDAV